MLCIQRFEKLIALDEMKNPYPKTCPDLNIKLFYAPPSMDNESQIRFCDLITLEDIHFHAAMFQHDKGIFGTRHHVVAVKALDRGQLGPFK